MDPIHLNLLQSAYGMPEQVAACMNDPVMDPLVQLLTESFDPRLWQQSNLDARVEAQAAGARALSAAMDLLGIEHPTAPARHIDGEGESKDGVDGADETRADSGSAAAAAPTPDDKKFEDTPAAAAFVVSVARERGLDIGRMKDILDAGLPEYNHEVCAPDDEARFRQMHVDLGAELEAWEIPDRVSAHARVVELHEMSAWLSSHRTLRGHTIVHIGKDLVWATVTRGGRVWVVSRSKSLYMADTGADDTPGQWEVLPRSWDSRLLPRVLVDDVRSNVVAVVTTFGELRLFRYAHPSSLPEGVPPGWEEDSEERVFLWGDRNLDKDSDARLATLIIATNHEYRGFVHQLRRSVLLAHLKSIVVAEAEGLKATTVQSRDAKARAKAKAKTDAGTGKEGEEEEEEEPEIADHILCMAEETGEQTVVRLVVACTAMKETDVREALNVLAKVYTKNAYVHPTKIDILETLNAALITALGVCATPDDDYTLTDDGCIVLHDLFKLSYAGQLRLSGPSRYLVESHQLPKIERIIAAHQDAAPTLFDQRHITAYSFAFQRLAVAYSHEELDLIVTHHVSQLRRVERAEVGECNQPLTFQVVEEGGVVVSDVAPTEDGGGEDGEARTVAHCRGQLVGILREYGRGQYLVLFRAEDRLSVGLVNPPDHPSEEGGVPQRVVATFLVGWMLEDPRLRIESVVGWDALSFGGSTLVAIAMSTRVFTAQLVLDNGGRPTGCATGVLNTTPVADIALAIEGSGRNPLLVLRGQTTGACFVYTYGYTPEYALALQLDARVVAPGMIGTDGTETMDLDMTATPPTMRRLSANYTVVAWDLKPLASPLVRGPVRSGAYAYEVSLWAPGNKLWVLWFKEAPTEPVEVATTEEAEDEEEDENSRGEGGVESVGV